jgi:hypothetical protein
MLKILNIITVLILGLSISCSKRKKKGAPPQPQPNDPSQSVGSPGSKDLSDWDIRAPHESGRGFKLPLKLRCLVDMSDRHSQTVQYALEVHLENNQGGTLILRRAENHLYGPVPDRHYRLTSTDPLVGSSFHDPYHIKSNRLALQAVPNGNSKARASVQISRINSSAVQLNQSGLTNTENYVIDQKLFNCEPKT